MINISLLIIYYLFIEFVAWSNYKYIMHGFLWKWHKDHYRKYRQHSLPEKTEDKRFEKSDLFFLVFALPAIIIMIMGFSFLLFTLVYLSFGITLCGLTYFIIHDIVIHNRINIPFFKKESEFLFLSNH